LKISFLCFDMSDNSLGRAALLARAAARHYPVELIGPLRGTALWEPLRDIELPVKTFPWKRYPAFARTLPRLVDAIEGDVLVACKLRPTSFGVGLLKKWKTGKPLVVDVDDWELGFFLHSGFMNRLGRFLNISNPNGMPYTWLMERLIGYADEVIVSNRFLQSRFSGTLIHHCRDTGALDPARYDAGAVKNKLGLTGKKVVMFLGTPRAHKGVDDLFAALEHLKDPELWAVVVGSDEPEERVRSRWPGVAARIRVFPKVPFAQLPEYLAAADVLVIPQRETSDTVGQMPAKIFDAMAMAKPTVSTRVSDIPEVLDDCGYLVDPGNVSQLAQALDHVFKHPEEARRKAQQARERCRELYDIRILETRLMEVIERAAARRN